MLDEHCVSNERVDMKTRDAAEPGAPGQSVARFRSAFSRAAFAKSRLLERTALILVWLVVIVVFSLLRPDTFFSTANASTMLSSQSGLLVLALAIIVPLTAGDFDLSLASTAELTAMLIAVLNVQKHWPILAAVLFAVGVALLIGFINGAVVILFRVESMIVTLGMGTLLLGIVLWISGSATIAGISGSLIDLVVGYRFLGVPLGFYYGLALCILLWYVMDYTPVGRRLLIVGRGREVARLSGIRVSTIRWGALMAASTIASLAGILSAGTSGAADPSSVTTLLLPAFAAAFLGATTISPGRFTAWGCLVAVYFLVTGITGLQLLGAESYVQDLFYGAALIVAVALSQLSRRRSMTGRQA
jgi:ribose transport system permease protein